MDFLPMAWQTIAKTGAGGMAAIALLEQDARMLVEFGGMAAGFFLLLKWLLTEFSKQQATIQRGQTALGLMFLGLSKQFAEHDARVRGVNLSFTDDQSEAQKEATEEFHRLMESFEQIKGQLERLNAA